MIDGDYQRLAAAACTQAKDSYVIHVGFKAETVEQRLAHWLKDPWLDLDYGTAALAD